VLNSSDEDYEHNLERLVSELKPQAFFDWVGGDTARKIFTKLPSYSTMYIYGALDKEGSFTFGNRELIGSRKTITALFLGDFLQRVLS
jgi:NADPH:quinone reductase-like Zn-dependent oxidoreductase